jgi:hypothetical protein
MAATDPREALRSRAVITSPITSQTELTTIHSSSVRVSIAERQTIMQCGAYGLIALLTLTALPLSARAACPTEWPLMWIKVPDLAAC